MMRWEDNVINDRIHRQTPSPFKCARDSDWVHKDQEKIHMEKLDQDLIISERIFYRDINKPR